MGQGPLLPVMPAVANAIFDAVGVRIDEIPITPEKILRALELKATGKNPRVGPERFPDAPYPQPDVVLPPWEDGNGKESKRDDAVAGFDYRAPRSVAEASKSSRAKARR